ncbi:hypothetical protein DFQ27_001957 [Actinomortierella ambigua]|uniref:Uncharacterized protein n=1 Tax=Actinomortierella ambigua TaxID=1343610 RepID=A0A9P6QIJ3_9FUNG|nr:hypothetical protein DFQ27_001957 [Actinomortierella ambigua]
MKRKHQDGQGQQPTITPIHVAPSIATHSQAQPTPSHTPFAPIQHPASQPPEQPTQNAATTSQFWSSPGMDAFVDWMTNPHNYAKFNNKKTGKKMVAIYDEIANYVSSKQGVAWTREQVKSKIQYCEEKYDSARALTNATGGGGTDETTLCASMLAICPYYDRFDAIYRGSLIKNPLPMRHSKEDIITRPPIIPEALTDSGSRHDTKRARYSKDSEILKILECLESIQQAAQNAQAQDMSMAARYIERERTSNDLLARRQRTQEDMFNRRLQDLLDEKEDFKRQKEDFKKEKEYFMKEKESFMKQRELFQKEVEAFWEQRDALFGQNIAMKTLLETIVVPRIQTK